MQRRRPPSRWISRRLGASPVASDKLSCSRCACGPRSQSDHWQPAQDAEPATLPQPVPRRHLSRILLFILPLAPACSAATHSPLPWPSQRLTAVPMRGKVDLKNPQVTMVVSEDFGSDHNDPPEEPCQVFIGRLVARSKRGEAIRAYDLKVRNMIGNTSMDPELSLIMANMGLARPGSLVLDPFVGTGAIAVCAVTRVCLEAARCLGGAATTERPSATDPPCPRFVPPALVRATTRACQQRHC